MPQRRALDLFFGFLVHIMSEVEEKAGGVLRRGRRYASAAELGGQGRGLVAVAYRLAGGVVVRL